MQHVLVVLMAGLQKLVADGIVPVAEVELSVDLVPDFALVFTVCVILLQIGCNNVVKVAVGLCSACQRGLRWAIAESARLCLDDFR